jgi:hypothetical protein
VIEWRKSSVRTIVSLRYFRHMKHFIKVNTLTVLCGARLSPTMAQKLLKTKSDDLQENYLTTILKFAKDNRLAIEHREILSTFKADLIFAVENEITQYDDHYSDYQFAKFYKEILYEIREFA